MITDWVLVRRAAYELEARLRGARVSEAGLLPDGRLALLLHARRESVALVLDVFGTPPVLTLEPDRHGVAASPGFGRALAALRGSSLRGVAAKRGDRVLRLTFGSRSSFGVSDELELYAELVPRFGNAVLVKRGLIVAAAKEFSLAQNPARAIEPGVPYVPPPAREGSPVPKALAASGYDDDAVCALVESDEAMRAPVYVYREDGNIVAAHLVPLQGFDGAASTREASLLDVLREAREQREGRGERERTARRRNAISKRLDERERKLRTELDDLAAKQRRAEERETLRAQGEAIYAQLHELPQAERAEAKDRAAKLFASYKKLGVSLPHIEVRRRAVLGGLESVETLRWELERAGDEDLADVELAVAGLDPRRAAPAGAPAKRRKRVPLEYRTPAGSRIVVGRSPGENAEVTFRIARPHDLWFHAQGIPGAHVILARDDRSEAPPQDLEAAAALAAFHSKARSSPKVPVDYTLRKFVRKQQDAPPGLVWYTHPKTVLVRPSEEPS